MEKQAELELVMESVGKVDLERKHTQAKLDVELAISAVPDLFRKWTDAR
jgi:hypothetical protein